MKYNESTTTTLHYGYADFLEWIKADAARVLKLSATEILDTMVKITPEDIKELDITVTYSKNNTNIKQ